MVITIMLKLEFPQKACARPRVFSRTLITQQLPRPTSVVGLGGLCPKDGILPRVAAKGLSRTLP